MKKPSLASLKRKLWKLVSIHVRSGAADSGGYARCYTCGVVKPWKELQAGHAIPGRHGAVLFDLEIIKPQCYRCNVPMKGMHHIFSTNLIKEHSMEWWEKKEIDSHKIMKYYRSDLEDLIERYQTP